MEISKGLQEEILAVQNKLKNAIRDHQICVGKLKDDPNNTDILAQIQKIHLHIVSLGRCQKQVVQRLRKEVETFKTENANGAKVSIASLLGLNNNNHITNNNEAKLKTSSNDCKTKPSKQDYEEHIVRNGDVRSPPKNSVPPKERPRSVETISGEDDVIEVSMDENSNEKVEQPQKECKAEGHEKLNFLCALGLITTSRCAELQNKRAERKRRSTANPQFVYASLEVPTKRKRHSYLQSSGSAPQTRQTTARMNGPSPPPAKTAPPKSTSPPSRTVMKSLIPVQKSTTRPNILRNVTESKVFVNKPKVENGPSQTQLPMPTMKSVQSVGSKTVHIPGLPSSLTIERIENDSAICISCRNPGTLTVCENCSSKYHVSCHSVSPAPPRICPKCAQLAEDEGDEIEEVDAEDVGKRCKPIKKDMELATTSQAPGIIRKAREDSEVYKTAGGLHKTDATQNNRGLTSALGINQLPSSTFLIPISSNNVSGASINQSDGNSSVNSTAGNHEQRGNTVSYPPIVINQLSQPSITYIQAEPQVSYGYQLPASSAQPEKHQSYLIVQQLADSVRRTNSSSEEQSHNNMLNTKRSTTTSRNLPIQPKASVASDSPTLFNKQLSDSIHRNRKKPTNRAVPALNRIFNTENLSITDDYQLERSTVNGRKSRAKPARTKLCINQLRSTRATDILLPSYDTPKSDKQSQIAKSDDSEEPSLLSAHAKYKPRTSGVFHSLFTSHNKSYIISDSSRESRDIDTAGKEHSALQQQLYHQDYQLEPSQPSEPPPQLQRGALTKFFEHVKLEEAHLPAPPRAKLVYKGSLTPEASDLGVCENEHIGGYGISTKSSADTTGTDENTEVKQMSSRLLINTCDTNENDSTKSTDSLDSSNGSTTSISDCITYEHKLGNTYVTIESEAQKTDGAAFVPELTVLRCAEPYDEIVPEKWRERKSSVSLYNAQSNLLELPNEVSVPDDKADTERQDLLSGRCSSNSSASQSDTPEQAMHESIEQLGIGTVSPESMQVLEQFESAMLETDHSNAATC